MLQQELVREFKRRFGALPAFVVRAPSRVNLIGEHNTDYNDGFVLPMAIDRVPWIALRPRSDKRVVVHALDLKTTAEFNLDSLKKGKETWAEYIKGVAWVLQSAGHKLHGWAGGVVSNVPSERWPFLLRGPRTGHRPCVCYGVGASVERR